MRVFDQVWRFRGSAFTDLTALSFTGMAETVQAGDVYYLAATDWLAGILFLGNTGSAVSDFTIELFNGEEFVTLQQERQLLNLASSFTWDASFRFQSAGVLTWGKTRETPIPERATNVFPENIAPTAPPATVTRNWYRITFTSAGPVLDTVFPVMYNTYTTPEEMAEFLGLSDFSEISQPNLNYIRRSIRDTEDWLDHYTRKSWRLRSTVEEGANFNPYGFLPKRRPVIQVTRLALWDGGEFEVLNYGRSEDYWLDRETSMVYLTLPSFRMRYYSWLLSRYIRSPSSIVLDYIYGADFETHEEAEDVAWITKRLVGADLVRTNDETGIFRSGLDILTKGEKLSSWREEAMERADALRAVYMTGLGTGQW